MKKFIKAFFVLSMCLCICAVITACTTPQHEHEYDNVCDATCECGYEREVSHDYEWVKDADGHYQDCKTDGCDAKTEKEEHEYDNVCDATCECGYEREVSHDFATEWSKDETHHYHACKTSGCTEKADIEEHEYDNVCDATCECGYEREVSHDYEWVKDVDGHYQDCKTDGCDAKTEKEEHDWDNGEVTTPAQPGVDGVKTFTCLVCGQIKTEPVEYVDDSKYKVTEEQWALAMNYSGDMIVYTDMYFLVGEDYEFEDRQTLIVNENLLQMDDEYYQKDGDKYYSYRLTIEGDENNLFDVYEKEEQDSFYFNMIKYQFSHLAGLYASFEYVIGEGYCGENVSVQGVTYNRVVVKIEDGKLIQAITYDVFFGEEMKTVYTLEYTSVELSVPSLERVPHVHNYEWYVTSTEHEEYCNCGLNQNQGYHDWDDGVPSADDPEKLIYTCSICAYSIDHEPEHVCIYDMKTIEPTCSTRGYDLYTCSCGDSYKENFVGMLDHTYSNGVCTCGFEQKLEGIEFVEYYDYNDYARENPIGFTLNFVPTNISGEVVVPATYDGLPVLKIGDKAFNDCANVTKIILPDSLKEIGENAFKNCTALQFNEMDGGNYLGSGDNLYFALVSVDNVGTIVRFNTINENTKIIAGGAFFYEKYNSSTHHYEYGKLEEVTIPASVISIGKGAFNNCIKLKHVYFAKDSKLEILGDFAFAGTDSLYSAIILPTTVRGIGNYCFRSSKLRYINIPEGVTYLAKEVFNGVDTLEGIILPKSLETIDRTAFWGTRNVRGIYYAGSQEDWDKIDYPTTNAYINGQYSNRVYYSETEKAGCWYYNKDGRYPLLWDNLSCNEQYEYILQNATLKDGTILEIVISQSDGVEIGFNYSLMHNGTGYLKANWEKSETERYEFQYNFKSEEYYAYYYVNDEVVSGASAKVDAKTFTLETTLDATTTRGEDPVANGHLQVFEELFRQTLTALGEYLEGTELDLANFGFKEIVIR